MWLAIFTVWTTVSPHDAFSTPLMRPQIYRSNQTAKNSMQRRAILWRTLWEVSESFGELRGKRVRSVLASVRGGLDLSSRKGHHVKNMIWGVKTGTLNYKNPLSDWKTSCGDTLASWTSKWRYWAPQAACDRLSGDYMWTLRGLNWGVS